MNRTASTPARGTVHRRRDVHDAALRDRLADAAGLLCGLDFDGTLAPIAPEPDAATVDPACREAVADLAERPNVSVAVVSGRAVADVRDRLGLDDVVYAGNHGLELARGDEATVHAATADQREAVSAVAGRVADRLADVDGPVVEDKGPTATVHYRQVAPDAVSRVREAVEAAVAAVDVDLAVSEGKAILEVRPDVPWDKGEVVERLAADRPADWATLYVGDDVTDEDAFEAVEPDGIGVHVGDDPTTAASLRLADRRAVAPFLSLVEQRVEAVDSDADSELSRSESDPTDA